MGSTAEVLAAAFARWELDLFPRLRGGFAIAVWNRRERRLVLARDPVGERTLLFAALPGGHAIASELRALLCHPRLDRRIDHDDARARQPPRAESPPRWAPRTARGARTARAERSSRLNPALAIRTATQLAAQIRRKQVGCLELLEIYLARVWAHNPRLNAIITLDEEGARRRARAPTAPSPGAGPGARSTASP